MLTRGAHELTDAHRLFGKNPPVTLVIAAHPDDEVIGAAAALMNLRERGFVVHVTDGSPRNLEDAHRAGFGTSDAYAQARRAESRSALAFADGVKLLDGLGVQDQTAAHCMFRLTNMLVDLLTMLQPDVILTHAFEGGHPDHDAVAFAAAHAARACAITVLEMSGYFEDGTGMATNRFATENSTTLTHPLNRNEQSAKRRMLNCFRTQSLTLAAFGITSESYRTADAYDFAGLPNGGRVLYDRFDWGLRSSEWPGLVAEAQRQLGRLAAA